MPKLGRVNSQEWAEPARRILLKMGRNLQGIYYSRWAETCKEDTTKEGPKLARKILLKKG